MARRARRPAGRRALVWATVALLFSIWIGKLHDYRGWDQSFYLAMTSSLVEDGDLDMRNDFVHIQQVPRTLTRMLYRVRPNGALTNTFAIGTPLVWMPAYAASLPLRELGAGAGARWAPVQLAALHLTALGLMTWLLWALDRWLRRMGVGGGLAILGALVLVLGTPVVIYGFRGYTGSHLASTVAVMWLVLAAVQMTRRPTTVAALVCGVALGVAFLCRWQDLLKGAVLLVPAIELARRRLPLGRGLQLAVVAGAAALAVAGLQLHGWMLERGEIFSLPQGPHYVDLTDPRLDKFLFSGLAGVVPWSPLFVVGIFGLLLPWKVRLPAAWRWVALGLLLIDIYLNSCVHDWWGGVAYGPRRLASDVPLLALGLGNLAVRRRWRGPVVAALAICCVWGMVTVNLRMHGLRDLTIPVLGHAADAPGAEREGGGQPSPAEARAAMRPWPLRAGRMSYFPREVPWGRPLTWAIGALFCALLGWALSRPRAPAALGPFLLTLGGLVLLAHLRLLAGPRADPDERGEWLELARAARWRAARQIEMPATVVAASDRHADARRVLWVSVLRRRGQVARARELVAALERPYPVTPALHTWLALEEGQFRLHGRTGHFFAVSEEQPTFQIDVARRVDPASTALTLRVALVPEGWPSAERALLLELGRGGEPPLVRIEGDATAVGLVGAGERREAELAWQPLRPYRLVLRWRPGRGEADLTVTGPDDAVTRLAVPASASGGIGRLQMRFGTPAEAGPGYGAPLGARFSELLLVGRDIGGEE